MKFKCNFCNYETDVKFAYEKHLITKKHLEKVQEINKGTADVPDSNLKNTDEIKIYKCKYCAISYSTSGSLVRHKKICEDKKLIEDTTKNELEHYKEMHQSDLKEIKHLTDTVAILMSENANLKSLVNNAGNVIKTSVSTMSYVLQNYKDAPALVATKDFSALHYEQTNEEFVEDLVREHKHKLLGDYIGDFIVKTYKKDDPSKQSIWNSDTSRLTYAIREIIKKKVDWRVDKKGIKTVDRIINPVLHYVEKSVREYMEAFDMDYDLCSTKEAEKRMLKLKGAAEILTAIKDKVLSEDVNRYIAPHFYLDKGDPTVLARLK